MKKFFIDILLAILFLATMSFYFLPRIAHEILGLAMFAVILVHVYFNRRQIFSLTQGKFTKRKIFFTLIFFSLALLTLAILISGICMSNYLFKDFISREIQRNMTIHQIHVSLPYVLIIFSGLHIGIHWQEIWGRISNFFKPEKNSLLYKIFTRLAVFILFCVGIYGSFLNRVGDRILMKHIFATPATEYPLPVFVFLIFSIISVYTVTGFFINKFLK